MPRLLSLLLAALLLLPAAALAQSGAEVEVEESLYLPAMLIREGNFRADPSTAQPPLGTYQAGLQVLVLGVAHDKDKRPWYLVRLYDTGQEGWMIASLLRPLPVFPNTPDGLTVTEVKDPAERDLLIGGHAFTFQRVDAKNAGELIAFEDLGLIYLEGNQAGSGKTAEDWIEVRGFVSLIEANRFHLVGSVEYRVEELTGQGTCRDTGVFTFERGASRKNWRLTKTTSPCGRWDQIVDLLVRDE